MKFLKFIRKKILIIFIMFFFYTLSIKLNFNNINAIEKNIIKYEKYKGPQIILNKNNIISENFIKRLIIKNDLNSKILSESEINRLLIKMYETNLFNDIKIEYKNSILYINIEENKIISRFEINGDKQLKNNKNLEEMINLKPGKAFNEYEFDSILKKTIEFYKDLGYLNVNIKKSIKYIKNSNLVEVKINIIKGDIPKISKIFFKGNKIISNSRLKEELFFKEYNLLKIFSPKAKFVNGLSKMNSENLEKFYKKNGFLDYKLISEDIIFNPKTNNIDIFFEIYEGQRFIIDEISVDTKFPLNAKINKIIYSLYNDVYNKTKLDLDSKEIKKLLAREKINADVSYEYERKSNGLKNSIKLIYKIKNGHNIFIDKINISGNTRTKDSVIRNQITIHEGDLFNIDAIETSYRRIYNLNFFENIALDYKKSLKEGMFDIFIDLEEKKTGQVEFRASYQTSNTSFIAGVSYHEKNIFGTGNTLGFSAQKGKNFLSLSSSYYKNNIFGTILGAGFSVFYQDSRNDKLLFDTRDYGFSVNTSVPLFEDLYIKLRYTLKSNNIHNISPDASETVKSSKKTTTSSALSYELIYDKRNFIDYPTSGYYLEFLQEINGIGGDKYFLLNDLSFKFYKTLFNLDELKSNKNAIVFQFKNNAGIIKPFNNYTLSINDRFFLSQFRGFEDFSGISPMDINGKTIGGDRYIFGTAQIEAPINFAKDFNAKFHIFVDYGNLFVDKNNVFSNQDIENNNIEILSSNNLRASAGFGIYFETPLAPIHIALGYPIIYDKELDKKKYIYFAMSRDI